MRSEPWEVRSQYIYFRDHAAAPGMRQANMASRLGRQAFAKEWCYLGQTRLGKCRSSVVFRLLWGFNHAANVCWCAVRASRPLNLVHGPWSFVGTTPEEWLSPMLVGLAMTSRRYFGADFDSGILKTDSIDVVSAQPSE